MSKGHYDFLIYYLFDGSTLFVRRTSRDETGLSPLSLMDGNCPLGIGGSPALRLWKLSNHETADSDSVDLGRVLINAQIGCPLSETNPNTFAYFEIYRF
jgi:hypothetical protein